MDGLISPDLLLRFESKTVLDMPEFATFDHFARDLFLHSLHFKMLLTDIETFDAITITEDASFVLTVFSDGHSELFRQIFERTRLEILQTDKQFLKFTIPRCLNLIDKNRFWYSVMLVASFLQEFVIFLRDTRVCYRFYFTAYKCLAAVFERTFKNSFESNGGFKGLEKYLKHVIETCDYTEDKPVLSILNDGDKLLCSKVVNLIKNCDYISNDFDLNEREISLLKNDVVKDIVESLDCNKADKDPLNLSWPPVDEVIDGKLNNFKEATLRESQSSNYHNSRKDMDESSPSDLATKRDLDSSPSNNLTAEKDMVGSSQPPSDPNSGKDSSSAPPYDLNVKKDMDASEEDEYRNFHSSLEECIPKIEDEEGDKFLEKIQWRTCSSCGIKCYQFSYKLFTKQVNLALTSNYMQL